MRKLDKKKILSILMFVTAIVNFIVYFLHKDLLYLILGCAWICIGIGNSSMKK